MMVIENENESSVNFVRITRMDTLGSILFEGAKIPVVG